MISTDTCQLALAFEEGSPQMGRALVGFLAALGACFASGFGGVPWWGNLWVAAMAFFMMALKGAWCGIWESVQRFFISRTSVNKYLRGQRPAQISGLHGNGSERFFNLNLASKCSACHFWCLHCDMGGFTRGWGEPHAWIYSLGMAHGIHRGLGWSVGGCGLEVCWQHLAAIQTLSPQSCYHMTRAIGYFIDGMVSSNDQNS